MATAGQVTTRALRLLGVVSIGRDAAAEEMADGLVALERMLAAWELEGVRLGSIVGTTLTSSTDLPLMPNTLDAVEYGLAYRLATEYGKAPDPMLAERAERGFQAVQAAYVQVPLMALDSGLVSTYRRRF